MNSAIKKMNTSTLHLSNMKLVLRLIKDSGQISRSDITNFTGLTPPTVTKIIDSLVFNYKLVDYVGIGTSNGGRPPVIVRFKNETNYIIGIDLGATYIRGCLTDLDANFISEIQVPTEIEKGSNHIINKVLNIVNRFCEKQGAEVKIWGVGIGVAGLVNKKTGVIEASPDFGWSHIDLQKEIGKKIDIPIFYDNSTRLMALGELYFNKKSKIMDFAIINVGYGIAAGLVIHGNLVKGHAGFAGEFGHIPVDTCSPVQCKCGMNGCLEALASGHRIANMGKKALKSNSNSMLFKLSEGKPELVSAETVGNAAKQGDEAALRIFEEVGDYLAQGIGVLTNLLNPEVIYIGGGISLNGKFFFDLVNQKASAYLLPPNKGLKILPSTFRENATAIGAVSLVMEKIMNLELSN